MDMYVKCSLCSLLDGRIELNEHAEVLIECHPLLRENSNVYY